MNPTKLLLSYQLQLSLQETLRMEAIQSPCLKLGFGVVIGKPYEDSDGCITSLHQYWAGSNAQMEPLAELCKGECIRSKIASRTQSMVGACAHAEERSLWWSARHGFNLREAIIFVQGATKTGHMLEKDKAEFSCIRCAVAMHLSGVRGVAVRVGHDWFLIDPDTACKQAIKYATGEIRVPRNHAGVG